MPNRLIREGIIDSERVNALSWFEEVFYRRLLNKVDDFGRYDARPRFLLVQLFGMKIDDAPSDADISAALTACTQAGLVQLYEVDGKPYLQVLDFRQQVRTKKSRWPAPPCGERCRAGDGQEQGENGADDTQTNGRCTADDEQMHSTCVADDMHLHTKTESETETDIKALTPRKEFEPMRAVPLPQDATEVKRFMSAQAVCGMIGEDLTACADTFYNEMESVGWVNRNMPIRDWRPLARNWLTKWQRNNLTRRPATKTHNTKRDCNDATDYGI